YCGLTLVQLGIIATYQGDDERATACHTQGLAVLREFGDKYGIAYALNRSARDVTLRQGHYDRRQRPLRRASSCAARWAIVGSAKCPWTDWGEAPRQRDVTSGRPGCLAQRSCSAKLSAVTLPPPTKPTTTSTWPLHVPHWRRPPLPQRGPRAGR